VHPPFQQAQGALSEVEWAKEYPESRLNNNIQKNIKIGSFTLDPGSKGRDDAQETKKTP